MKGPSVPIVMILFSVSLSSRSYLLKGIKSLLSTKNKKQPNISEERLKVSNKVNLVRLAWNDLVLPTISFIEFLKEEIH